MSVSGREADASEVFPPKNLSNVFVKNQQHSESIFVYNRHNDKNRRRTGRVEQAYLFNIGCDCYSYRMLGSRPVDSGNEEAGFHFCVWAPSAAQVSVVGDFNAWDPEAHPMSPVKQTGIWEADIAEAHQWSRYKYAIISADGQTFLKCDPYARHCETRPADASICYDPEDYTWTDDAYMNTVPTTDTVRPVNIYELHLGSWRRYPDGNLLNYRTIGAELAEYCKKMGYTHVEFMPIMEHPLDASWGYQVTGYFAATSRFGTPADLKYCIDHLHRNDIGVILDWVPAHFPKNGEGLALFDGQKCYEYADDRLGEHKEWGTCVFDYSKAEVRSFLLSNAVFWLSEFHVDGLRIDAVSSMLYRNYGRRQFLPNQHGGVENLEVISFFKDLNARIREMFPHAYMMAEESTAWPQVTDIHGEAGLGFTHKWNMGWMHDTLDFFSTDYYARNWRRHQLSFSMTYTFSERFVLALSHDEVVHGKSSLIGKMPGDNWRKFASLRMLYLYTAAHPGVKFLFMGSEFGQFIEWREYESLEWFLLEYEPHRLLSDYVSRLNHFYIDHPAMWANDRNWEGFMWLSLPGADDPCVFAFKRMGAGYEDDVYVVMNMIPAPMERYKLPVDRPGEYEILLNTDSMEFGGSGYPVKTGRETRLLTVAEPCRDQAYSIELCLPPLGGLFLMKKGIAPLTESPPTATTRSSEGDGTSTAADKIKSDL